ncbi:Synemin [Larimichthys crocea]|uniref:Uncharacterized protein n=1 Tax=Larimichthys crocea TaxID=215358 RepID=A0ACD3QFH6_LARCR|nr:Synemin [Larimichthys crocea]
MAGVADGPVTVQRADRCVQGHQRRAERLRDGASPRSPDQHRTPGAYYLNWRSEYKCLEDAHRQEMEHLRRQVESRVVPIITQTYRGPPAASMEEVQEYARGMSEGWMETFEMYQQKVEEMEQSIKADREKLSDLQREKMLYASELDKLRTEAENQGQVQLHLEEQLMHMQEKFRMDCSEYQMNY